jgi:heat shock protein HslJ
MKIRSLGVILAFAGLAMVSASFTFAGVQKSKGANPLSGTSWQLVRFEGDDERTFAPDDKSRYTITFGSNGRVTARVDCNTASSTWRVVGKDELAFGSWSRTSAKCGPGSLHDKIVTEGAAVHKFEIKDGHLFLSGMAAGGYYELEAMRQNRAR